MSTRRSAIDLFHPRVPGGVETLKRLGEYGLEHTMIGRVHPSGTRWFIEIRHASPYRRTRTLHIPEAVACETVASRGLDGFVAMAAAVLGRT